MNTLTPRPTTADSMKLGEVIEEVEHRQAGFGKNIATRLLLFVFFGALTLLGSGTSMRLYVVLATCVSASALFVLVLKFWSSHKRFLRIHENGVSVIEGDASTEIHFSQLDTYTCRIRINFSLVFEVAMKSNSLDEPRVIKWSSSNLDDLHVRISERVADNMEAMLESNKRVSWGESAFICDHGVEVKKKTGILSSEMRFIPWAEIEDIKFYDAKLFLSCVSTTCRFEISCAEPNVFAGFLLVSRKMKDLYGDWVPGTQSNEGMPRGMEEIHISAGI